MRRCPGLTARAGRARRPAPRKFDLDASSLGREAAGSPAASSTTPTSSTPPPSSAWPGIWRTLLAAVVGRRRTRACSRAAAARARPSGTSSCATGTTPRPAIPARATIHDLFAAQAARTPDAVAVACRRARRSPTASSTRRADAAGRAACAALGVGPEVRGRPLRGALAGADRRRCSASSRPAAPTCRSIPPIPRSGWPSCSRTPGAVLLVAGACSPELPARRSGSTVLPLTPIREAAEARTAPDAARPRARTTSPT